MNLIQTNKKKVYNVLDVSKYQGNVDYEKVKASGNVDFVIARSVSTSKGEKYIDPKWERNYSECKRMGLPIGTYFYSVAKNWEEFSGEIDLCFEALNSKTLELPLAMDIESESCASIGKDGLTAMILQGKSKIEDKCFYPMLYSGLNYSQNYIDMNKIEEAGLDFWLAAYRKTEPDLEHTMWQYTSQGSVEGVSGDCDLSYCYTNYPQIVRWMTAVYQIKRIFNGL